MRFKYSLLATALALPLLSTASLAADLMVYSSRNASYIKPLLNEYALETGVAVNYLVSPAVELISRLENEAQSTQAEIKKADLMIASGAEYFWMASEKGLLASVQSSTLSENVPAHLTSPKQDWFGFASRARTIVYNPTKVKASELSSYSDLASPKWKAKLCLLTSQSAYTQAFVAMLAKHEGEERTAQIMRGWVDNLAVAPFGEDIQVLDAINQGRCDVGIVNSYYFIRFKRQEPDTKLKLFWTDQKGTGTHVNITGAAVVANTPNQAQAIDFLEWLTTKEPQATYAKLSMEYPANPDVYPAREVARLGKFKMDTTNLSNIGMHLHTAQKLAKEAGYP
ncbi:extracellular solute-binding protein [Neptuniibacter sp. 1_MG-2023]|uniref:extracellular solute-binding protein n=1 Tax=Neptuniibacter sp. 1_MG-2023 TaxID=3062662 RepID=UPI0026E11DF5|nr:extracellular solute-binding protein [Neptuniibacter sp. 1_MG-2023]MDO6593018.1 extracellular solute-binding protein [Neptuniibacter sp. 1_MG-2023]